MTLRALPSAAIGVRPGLQSKVTARALETWNPDIRQAAESEDNTISILDVIGADYWGEGVTAKRIAAALRAIGNKDVVVNINSPGGNYFEGLAIYNTLREHKGKVTVKILGVAASAASVIAMAGDEIQIARAGFLMIHNAWVVASGDRHQLREVADFLEPFDAAAVDIYVARSGMDSAEVAKMLDRETWIGGAEAVDKGFADTLLSADEVAAAPENSANGKAVVAAHQIDNLLAQLNMSRSQRRELIQALKGGKQDAALTSKQDAAVLSGVEDLLSTINALKTSA
ncbi:Clp protease ClpP [Agrobacterium tumefaciens]|uniref:head maturation protease, ClpP-related n=1 Tax=Agrobacterium tumefaciens TaxID=358 RepID=UPI00157429AB|nr:head maturation protease, ClpP-related [Agrobacterium tumefaciens]NTB96911.1 Clp protease ClpP [Agrobacterium tumefaciens]NTC44175.1 Clp protease ClpP [Agrobacterium tumefaciens]